MGSDLAGLRTTARRDGDAYVVNGSKTFITNGINSDLIITAVKTDPTQRHAGISLLILERGMEGFERGRNLEKVGQHAQDTAELFFEDVHVPVENRLGEEGQGFRYMTANLAQERLSIGLSALAAARGALDVDPGVRQGAHGLRAGDRVVSELALRAGRDGHRDRGRHRLLRSGGAGPQPRSSSPRQTPRWRSGGRPSCRGG